MTSDTFHKAFLLVLYTPSGIKINSENLINLMVWQDKSEDKGMQIYISFEQIVDLSADRVARLKSRLIKQSVEKLDPQLGSVLGSDRWSLRINKICAALQDL